MVGALPSMLALLLDSGSSPNDVEVGGLVGVPAVHAHCVPAGRQGGADVRFALAVIESDEFVFQAPGIESAIQKRRIIAASLFIRDDLISLLLMRMFIYGLFWVLRLIIQRLSGENLIPQYSQIRRLITIWRESDLMVLTTLDRWRI